jgi:DNA-binding MarR family transcriptional regulator
MGATTAGKLSELTGLTSGAITRVIDRLEQSGFVRRIPDPADRRRVIVEVVPEKVASIQATLDRVGSASAQEIGRYTDAQLSLIAEFLTRMEQITRDEATTLREAPAADAGPDGAATSEHRAPLGGLTSAKLHVRSGLSTLRLRGGDDSQDLYRAAFEGATPYVRVRDGRVIVAYRGLPFDWRKRVATLGLNPTIPWSVEVVGGIQTIEADLREVDLRRFELTGGIETARLDLGAPVGEVGVRLVGGARTIQIERPREVAMRVRLQGGTGSLVLDGRSIEQRSGHVSTQTTNWSSRSDRYDVEIVGGSRSVEIVGRA